MVKRLYIAECKASNNFGLILQTLYGSGLQQLFGPKWALDYAAKEISSQDWEGWNNFDILKELILWEYFLCFQNIYFY